MVANAIYQLAYMTENIANSATLTQAIKNAHRIVFFGGAGVSTESGIPDFRSANGLYAESGHAIAPERIISASFFHANPEQFYQFYKEKMIYHDAQPNPAHYALAKLERIGKLSAVITQNIDGLHQRAGSKNVIELHGSIHRNHCMKCQTSYELETIINSGHGLPICPSCGGLIRPNVVLYEEPLPEGTVETAIHAIQHADLLIIGGTSLIVQPAASLIRYFNGNTIALINLESTSADSSAHIVIHAPVGQVLGTVIQSI